MTTLFTVRSGCDDCQVVYSEFTGVAYSFAKNSKPDQNPAFFGVLYYTSDPRVRELFTTHNFKTVPYIATSKEQKKREGDLDFYKTEDVWLVKKDEMSETQIQLDFINKRLNTDVQVSFPFVVVLFKNVVLFVVLFVLLAAFIRIRSYLIDPMLWLGIAVIGYLICTSGVVYTMLHSVPVFKFDQDQYGKMYVSEYFMRNQRQQYGGEGYIISFLSVLISMMILFISKIDVIFSDDFSRRAAVYAVILFAFTGI